MHSCVFVSNIGMVFVQLVVLNVCVVRFHLFPAWKSNVLFKLFHPMRFCEIDQVVSYGTMTTLSSINSKHSTKYRHMSYVSNTEKFIWDVVIAPFLAYYFPLPLSLYLSRVRRFGSHCLLRCVIRPSSLNVLWAELENSSHFRRKLATWAHYRCHRFTESRTRYTNQHLLRPTKRCIKISTSLPL